jgi:DNA-binding CsgD family transcriptional regulator
MYALIGDVVGSRRLPDRAEAQQRIASVLDEVDGLAPGAQRLEVTIGDEFQGGYATLGEATRVSLLVRLALLPAIDVRCGIGFGEVTVFDESRVPLLQDGPAWWAARSAVEAMAAPRRTAVRTWFVGPEADLVNAFLACRDALVERLSDRARRMLRLSLLGASQQRIAAEEGISKSAVSQQFARGITAVRAAQALLAAREESVGAG